MQFQTGWLYPTVSKTIPFYSIQIICTCVCSSCHSSETGNVDSGSWWGKFPVGGAENKAREVSATRGAPATHAESQPIGVHGRGVVSWRSLQVGCAMIWARGRRDVWRGWFYYRRVWFCAMASRQDVWCTSAMLVIECKERPTAVL